MEKEILINPIFEPLFSDELDDPRYYQVYGGRASGKSFATAIAMVQKTYSPYKHKILYLRQVMTTSADSTVADVKTAIDVLGVAADFVESKGTITNKVTGSQIIFKGIRTSSGKQSAKLKSLSGITTLVVEEAEEIESFDEFSKIDESIRRKGVPLKVVLIYNPGSALTSWIHKEWFSEGQPDPERHLDTIYIHSTYKDNIVNLPDSLIARFDRLAETNPIYYQNTILAEWTLSTQNRLYAGWGMYNFFDEEECDTWYGLDWGYGGNDKTALVKIRFFDKVYYVQEIFSKKNMSINETVRAMRAARVPFNATIYADTAMPLLNTELRKKGYTGIRKAEKGNVEQGIKKVQNKNIVIVGQKDTDLYFNYMTFSRKKDGKLPHEPDILAALRYGINTHRPVERATEQSAMRRRARSRKLGKIRRNRGSYV